MTGRRRSSERQSETAQEHASERTTERSAEHAAELDEQSLLGNQAVAGRMESGPESEDPLAIARDAALPMVERAGLALQIEPKGPEVLARFETLIGDSLLDADRKASLLDRLQTDELVAGDVASAMRAAFGADGPDIRDAIDRTLDQVAAGLRDGAAVDGRWQLPDGRSVEPQGASRANGLIEAVGDAVGSSTATGARILAFCQRVQLALLLEEEEEPVGPDYETEEAAG